MTPNLSVFSKSVGFLLRLTNFPKSSKKEKNLIHFDRWRIVPASFLIQLSIGSVYAISMFTGPLSRNQGVVVASASDWTYPGMLFLLLSLIFLISIEVAQILSIMAVTLGVTTVCLGPWIEHAGPRKVTHKSYSSNENT